jgi:5-methylcytosine-specific restriction endonuclease McrA
MWFFRFLLKDEINKNKPMQQRFKDYSSLSKCIRKIFSEGQKRDIACEQKYTCMGEQCKGLKLLPKTWELDHIEPLFEIIEKFPNVSLEELKNYANRRENLVILCSGCHALKSRTEKINYFENERKHKFQSTYDYKSACQFYNSEENDNKKENENDEENENKTKNISRYFTKKKKSIDMLDKFMFKPNA